MIYIIGYGIQGRAHALNLRDSKKQVIIVNRNDSYSAIAKRDNFKVLTELPYKKINSDDIIYLLLPEEVHVKFLGVLKKKIRSKPTIVLAHGYTYHFNSKFFPDGCDLLMIAPRFPGEQVRSFYLNGHGVPAYLYVFRDVSGESHKKLYDLTNALGFDKGGTMIVSCEHETIVDLAIENIMAPSFFVFVQKLFNKLIERGVPKEVACMELYYSGETGAVRSSMSKHGLYKGLLSNASPTCQYGVASSSVELNSKKWIDDFIENRIIRIEKKIFSKELNSTSKTKKIKKNFFNSYLSKKIVKAEISCNKIFSKKK